MIEKSVSITGFGWLGQYLLEELNLNGYTTKVSVTKTEKASLLVEKKISAFVVDITQTNNIPTGYLNSSIHIIAIPPSKVGSNYHHHISAYLQLLPVSATVVFISSTSVYPSVSGSYNEESDVVDHTIVAAEKSVMQFTPRFIILRCAGLIDNQRHPANFLAGKTNLEGPNSTVNLIHGKDVAKALIRILALGLNGIYNLSLPAPLLKKDFYTTLCLLQQKTIPLFNEQSISVERNILTHKIQHLSFAFESTVHWYKKELELDPLI